MDKVEALEQIKDAWDDASLDLGKKIATISSAFYSAGLDLAGAASHLHATPSELDALLQMGQFDDGILDKISEVNPPKASWQVLSNSNDDEIEHALEMLKANRDAPSNPQMPFSTISEYVYSVVLDVSGPSKEQLVGNLPANTFFAIAKKGKDYKALPDKEINFLNNIAGQKKRGKTLSAKQLKWIIDILERLADAEVIRRDSIDGDQEMCAEILEAIGR